MENIDQKYQKLKDIILSYNTLAVAFSGGVDSTFLLKVAADVLQAKTASMSANSLQTKTASMSANSLQAKTASETPENNVVAITAKSISFPEREHKESEDFCEKNKIHQVIVSVDQMKIEGFANNPPDRCYLCKKVIFSSIIEEAKKLGITTIAEGSNADDTTDYRPGMRAIEELKVKSPLKEAGLTKEEIRILSKRLGLPTWSKPSFACLATRFVYGEEITEEKIKMAGAAEEILFGSGFSQARCRVHGDMARIEVPEDEIKKILEDETRQTIFKKIKALGFSYVSLDLQGYRTGSMNEILNI